MEEDPLLEHASKCLGDILIASNVTLSRMQKLRGAVSQDTLQVKELKRRETALYLYAADLHKFDLATKKILFEKSEEALGGSCQGLGSPD